MKRTKALKNKNLKLEDLLRQGPGQSALLKPREKAVPGIALTPGSELTPGQEKSTPSLKPREIKLTQEPNPLFTSLIQGLFGLWANGINDERMNISNKEAENVSLPVTQLVDYYLPMIPAIAYAWGSLLLTSLPLVITRVKVIKETKKQRKEQPQKNKCLKCGKELTFEEAKTHICEGSTS